MEAKKSADEFKLGIQGGPSSGDMIGENAKPGLKSDSSVKGKAGMFESQPTIHENSVESEVFCSPEEHSQDLTKGNAFEKRELINGGALNSSEKLDNAQFQQIYGLQHIAMDGAGGEAPEAEHDYLKKYPR